MFKLILELIKNNLNVPVLHSFLQSQHNDISLVKTHKYWILAVFAYFYMFNDIELNIDQYYELESDWLKRWHFMKL